MNSLEMRAKGTSGFPPPSSPKDATGEAAKQATGRDANQASAEAPDRMAMVFPVMYVISSSLLGIGNKWALLSFPYAGLLTAFQFLATFIVVTVLGKFEVLTLQPIEFGTMRKLAFINITFYAAIFCNTKILQHSNVETFIAFRSAVPLLVCFFDTLVRKQPAPSCRTVVALVSILVGAIGYATADNHFSVRAYGWAFAYLAVITFEMVYAKHVVSSFGLSTWDLVQYQNLIAVMIWPFVAIVSGEAKQMIDLWEAPPPKEAVLPVLITCVLGTAISFAGWGTRRALTATSFTVLGVACKLATVAINLFAWRLNAGYTAQVPILLCIFASVGYQKSAECDRKEREQAITKRGEEATDAPES